MAKVVCVRNRLTGVEFAPMPALVAMASEDETLEVVYEEEATVDEELKTITGEEAVIDPAVEAALSGITGTLAATEPSVTM